ncbi:AraC family transcriptional regulator [Paraflavitalea sp. CAU 1676]|uniref:helix-turn-helix domain-containing protein n=1 Tax=Paraflavitalea sp. CAU 1676 TaxID=3032598 RepID=UPI0023DB2B05|nr:AraC family transcriptional regulator [Paraflavitalea sp. CAU 1676]MDF2186932.1 AraC family transcriptional regulator [Paraflavitalea sp. CAU 1676]
MISTNQHLSTRHYSIPFPAMDCEQDFEQLAKVLNGELRGSDEILISGGVAKGVVKKHRMEPGCCIRTWNVIFNHSIELFKRGNRADHKNFSIVFVMTPDACRLKSVAGHEQYNQAETRSTLMVANSVDVLYDVAPYQPVQVLEISTTTFWLAQQFQRADLPLENLLDRVRQQEHPLILNHLCTAHVITQVNMLFEALMNSSRQAVSTDQLVRNLLVDFINKSLNNRVSQAPGNSDAHFIKVMEAEAILNAHLEANLPSMNDIAQQVSLSESTLKRHFKIIFGKSLYVYYLEKKMQLAKNLLQEQPITVYQTANRLGYEKVSNFIWIFKKHHGYSPGSLKKRNLTTV